jgi:hypothetical protein
MLAQDILGTRKKMSAVVCGGVNGSLTIEDTACFGGSGFATSAFQDAQITRPIKKLYGECPVSGVSKNPLGRCEIPLGQGTFLPLREMFVI